MIFPTPSEVTQTTRLIRTYCATLCFESFQINLTKNMSPDVPSLRVQHESRLEAFSGWVQLRSMSPLQELIIMQKLWQSMIFYVVPGSQHRSSIGWDVSTWDTAWTIFHTQLDVLGILHNTDVHTSTVYTNFTWPHHIRRNLRKKGEWERKQRASGQGESKVKLIYDSKNNGNCKLKDKQTCMTVTHYTLLDIYYSIL